MELLHASRKSWNRQSYYCLADSSLAYDRDEKASLYAQAGIAEYWVINLVDRQVEVFRDPGPDSLAAFGYRYRSQSTLLRGPLEALFAPGQLDPEEFFSAN